MKSSADIIAAALDAALSPRPLNYTAAGLAESVVAALEAEGYSILPIVVDGAVILSVPELAANDIALPIAGWADLEPEPKL